MHFTDEFNPGTSPMRNQRVVHSLGIIALVPSSCISVFGSSHYNTHLHPLLFNEYLLIIIHQVLC